VCLVVFFVCFFVGRLRGWGRIGSVKYNRLIPFIYTYPSDVSSEWLHTLIVFLLSYPKKGLIMQINQPIKSCCLNLVTVTYKCYLASTVLLFACCVLPTLVVTCVISYSDCSLTRKIKRTKVKSCVYRCLKGVPMATC